MFIVMSRNKFLRDYQLILYIMERVCQCGLSRCLLDCRDFVYRKNQSRSSNYTGRSREGIQFLKGTKNIGRGSDEFQYGSNVVRIIGRRWSRISLLYW
jgi:hypothetical protein